MTVLRLFASAREAAGTERAVLPGASVREVLDAACARFGPSFADVVARGAVWCNGEPADGDTPVSDDDEVAVIPPLSGGSARSGPSLP